MSIGLSIASGSLYEACRLRANRWTKADRTKMGWNNGANSNQLYRPEASRLLTEPPTDITFISCSYCSGVRNLEKPQSDDKYACPSSCAQAADPWSVIAERRVLSVCILTIPLPTTLRAISASSMTALEESSPPMTMALILSRLKQVPVLVSRNSSMNWTRRSW